MISFTLVMLCNCANDNNIICIFKVAKIITSEYSEKCANEFNRSSENGCYISVHGFHHDQAARV